MIPGNTITFHSKRDAANSSCTFSTRDAVGSRVSMRAATISDTLLGPVDRPPSLPVVFKAARDCKVLWGVVTRM